VSRRDELGELTAAFNKLAGALRDSHMALTRQATHDALTGLPNRASLTQRLAALFHQGDKRRVRHEAVLFIDVDDFKDVNDSLGHKGGDDLLVELAARLNACVRPDDLVARLGGDEFAIVISDDESGSVATEVAERILNAVRAPFDVDGSRLIVSVSIGIAQRRPEIDDAAELLRRADFAMYMAKGAGKGRYQLFDATMHDTMVSRSALKADLAGAVSSGQLRLEYQPVADLRTGEVLGLEALVRWQHPTLGLLPPADFITLAEETGDIDALGCWVLDTATRQVAAWRATMDHCSSLWVSVNLSLHQLASPSSLACIQCILADPAVQADNVVLEITETALAADLDGGVASLNTLKRLGVRLAIDDFGTGFSSLSTLASLPVDILKIDRAFVSGVSGSSSVPMLEGILGLAEKLSLAVIAEGIEEPEQLDLLRTLGCFTGQGYLLSRPVPADVIETLLATGGLLHVALPVTT
jgi:diguanylate cyclase (GGDEF)-like protein